METKLPPEFKAKWVAALRSGEYKQGKNYLFDPSDNSYCCLGVAGKICGADLVGRKKMFALYDRMDVMPPPDGFPIMLCRIEYDEDRPLFELTQMNDGGKTFLEIADYIEKEL